MVGSDLLAIGTRAHTFRCTDQLCTPCTLKLLEPTQQFLLPSDQWITVQKSLMRFMNR